MKLFYSLMSKKLWLHLTREKSQYGKLWLEVEHEKLFMQKSEKYETLINREFPFFDQEVRDMLKGKGILKKLKSGEVLMRDGNYVNDMTLVLEGEMKVYREDREGREIFLYNLDPGNACAISLVCGSKREISKIMIKTMADSMVILIPIQVMETLMKSNKSWYRFVIESYRYRFEDLLAAFDSVVFKRLDERLLEYLETEWERNEGRPLELTHQQIADDLYSTREVISRLLKKLEQQGKLTKQRNTITML